MANKKQFLKELKKDWKHTAISIKLNTIYCKEERIIKIAEAYNFLMEVWDKELINVQEQFMAVYLNHNRKIIGYRLLNKNVSSLRRITFVGRLMGVFF